MARRNQGPRLRYLADRKTFYITWTVKGRSRKLSTGTASRQEAENIFSEWLQRRYRPTGPSDPAQTLVTDMLTDYITDRGSKVIGKETMARAVENLARGWEGKTVAEVTPKNIAKYAETRGVAAALSGASLASCRPLSTTGIGRADSPVPLLLNFRQPRQRETDG
jgi:hypothetical protein